MEVGSGLKLLQNSVSCWSVYTKPMYHVKILWKVYTSSIIIIIFFSDKHWENNHANGLRNVMFIVLYSDAAGSRFLHNMGTYLPDYMVSHHRKLILEQKAWHQKQICCFS
jgi:hypothetical protein